MLFYQNGQNKMLIYLLEALESDFVSENIHNWIDLIFGYKQQGEEAGKNLNVFHYLSYEGAVDIDKIEDPVEKQSTISIIHNFGQTPRLLFKKPHSKRLSRDETICRIDLHYNLMVHGNASLKEIDTKKVSDVRISSSGLLLAGGGSRIYVPGSYHKYLEWGNFDDSLRIYYSDTNRLVAVFESLHIGRISIALFVDTDTLVTAGEDTTVCIWNFVNGKKPSIDLETCMRAHRKKVTCLSSSRAYSTVVSGGEDCVAIIWDLNRQQYVRTLEGHETPILGVYINDNTGDILTYDISTLKLWDINGNILFSQKIGIDNEPIHSALIFEGKSSEVFDSELFFTGHSSGIIRVWKKCFQENPQHPWVLELVHTLRGPYKSSINYLSVSPNSRFLLYGDSDGRVNSWMLPDGSQTEIHFSNSDQCFTCKSKFAVLGRRTNCKACGATCCSVCLNNIPDRQFKLCGHCLPFIPKSKKKII
jgi:WD40 repeat protein